MDSVFVLSRERNVEGAAREYWSREGEQAPGVFTDPIKAFEAAGKSGFVTGDNISSVLIERVGVE